MGLNKILHLNMVSVLVRLRSSGFHSATVTVRVPWVPI